ncbi:MAG TPA: MFS transporter [Streptosporangiaceae bacterium]|jgi:EmrB/QacA subfamily drug resistance transporter
MRKWMPLIAVCLGTFMLLVDVTIVTVALPDMAASLQTSFSALQWVVDIYALILAALLLGMGAVADLRGRRRLYIAGLVVFALASLASGLARSTGVLIAARGLQGIGGAAMYATTIALLSAAYRGRDRGIAFGVWGAVSGAAAAAGPILGGLLTESLSWRWIFFVNLPVSVIAIGMSRRALSQDSPARSRGLDLPGVLTFTAGAAAITYGLIRATAHGWTAGLTLGLLAAGVLAMAGFAWAEHRSPAPLLDLALLRRPAFSGVLAAALLLNAAAFACLPYSSLWLQSVLGLSPVRAGLEGAAPLSLAAFVISALIGRFLHGPSPRWIIGGGLLLIGAGALVQARVSADAGGLVLLPGLIVAGAGVGLATPTLVSTAMAAVPQRSGGMAAGAVNTARQLGFTFGVAVLGSAFAARTQSVLTARGAPPSVSRAVAGGQARAVLARQPLAQRDHLSALLHLATAAGLSRALLIAGLLGLAGAAVAIATMRSPASSPPVVADSGTAAAGAGSATAAASPSASTSV